MHPKAIRSPKGKMYGMQGGACHGFVVWGLELRVVNCTKKLPFEIDDGFRVGVA